MQGSWGGGWGDGVCPGPRSQAKVPVVCHVASHVSKTGCTATTEGPRGRVTETVNTKGLKTQPQHGCGRCHSTATPLRKEDLTRELCQLKPCPWGLTWDTSGQGAPHVPAARTCLARSAQLPTHPLPGSPSGRS